MINELTKEEWADFLSQALSISLEEVLLQKYFCYHIDNKHVENFVIENLKQDELSFYIDSNCGCGVKGKYLGTEDISVAGYIICLIDFAFERVAEEEAKNESE